MSAISDLVYKVKDLLDDIESEASNLYDEKDDLEGDVSELEEKVREQDDLQANGWDVVVASLPRDLDYGHALELRDLILKWNRDHHFLPTEPGL